MSSRESCCKLTGLFVKYDSQTFLPFSIYFRLFLLNLTPLCHREKQYKMRMSKTMLPLFSKGLYFVSSLQDESTFVGLAFARGSSTLRKCNPLCEFCEVPL